MPTLSILDNNRKLCAVVDTVFSLNWVERFKSAGVFTLVLGLDTPARQFLIPDNYIVIKESYFIMIIEDVNPTEEADGSKKLTVKGKTAEEILKWRVINNPIYVLGNIQEAILDILDNNFISPTNTNRAISFFEYDVDPVLAGITFDNSTLYDAGTPVYDIVTDLCDRHSLGFTIYLTETGSLRFRLYFGKDRSHLQTLNQRVIFSEKFDNVISTDYYQATANHKNVILVITDDEEPSLQKVTTMLAEEEPSGFYRRETSISLNSPRAMADGPELTVPEAMELIVNNGKLELYNYRKIGVIDGEVDINGFYKYKTHFYLGDIVVCLVNGIYVPCRIIERSYSVDEASGIVDHIAFDFDNIYLI